MQFRHDKGVDATEHGSRFRGGLGAEDSTQRGSSQRRGLLSPGVRGWSVPSLPERALFLPLQLPFGNKHLLLSVLHYQVSLDQLEPVTRGKLV